MHLIHNLSRIWSAGEFSAYLAWVSKPPPEYQAESHVVFADSVKYVNLAHMRFSTYGAGYLLDARDGEYNPRGAP
jgi:hypothetical protein